jgi:hypothetical protein
VLTIAAVVAAVMIGNPYRTSLGEAHLAGIRGLFADLRRRADSIQPGGGTAELAWLAAVFGLGAVPASAFPFVREFRAKREVSSGSGCGTSGCGSGGCGGGGGGGCGGCGT